MASKKVSELTELLALAANDLFAVVDDSEVSEADKNKKLKLSTLLDAVNTEINSAVNAALVSTLKPAGSIAFASLPTPAVGNLGNIYDVTDAFETTSAFVEGSGTECPAHTNVYCVTPSEGVYKWDLLGFNLDLSGHALKSELPSVMTGATSEANGTSGLVPQPLIADRTKFLAGDGTYKEAGTGVFDGDATDVPYTSGAGLVSNNVRAALDELAALVDANSGGDSGIDQISPIPSTLIAGKSYCEILTANKSITTLTSAASGKLSVWHILVLTEATPYTLSFDAGLIFWNDTYPTTFDANSIYEISIIKYDDGVDSGKHRAWKKL